MKTTLIISTAALKTKGAAELSPEFVEAVNVGNGRAYKFVYSSDEVVSLARRAERRLDRMDLPQADRVGFVATFAHAGPTAKAYKFTATGRSVTMRRAAKGWVLVAIDEINIYPQQNEKTTYRATEKQIAEAARRAVADLTQIAA
jgi:hypothetical protein